MGGQKRALRGSKKCIRIYAGQYYDQETGLHYNGYRYYNPSLGRYLRADPIGLNGGMDLYSYVQNNPINIIDPLGLLPENDGYHPEYPASEEGCRQRCQDKGQEFLSFKKIPFSDVGVCACKECDGDSDDKKKETCATKYPDKINCSALHSDYKYRSKTAALKELKRSTGLNNLKLTSGRPATGYPGSEYGGYHYGVKSGGSYIASLMSCPCCADTDNGPVLLTLWRIY